MKKLGKNWKRLGDPYGLLSSYDPIDHVRDGAAHPPDRLFVAWDPKDAKGRESATASHRALCCQAEGYRRQFHGYAVSGRRRVKP